ncbi:MAG: hypothetical protein ACFFHD_07285, partial [Promethearchaeota archaeon]
GIETFEDSAELKAINRSYEIVFYNNIPEYRGFQLDYNHAIILSQLVSPNETGTKEAIEKLIVTEILKEEPSKQITEHIQNRLINARNWVSSKYAPSHLRIQLKEYVSQDVLEQYDKKFRNLVFDLGKTLEKAKWTEEDIKQKMMLLRKEIDLSKKEMKIFFQILYQIFIGNTKGPRFAPFIAALDKNWVIKKLQEVSEF